MVWDGVKQSFGARSRNRTGMALRPADFKSAASTDFAIRACCCDAIAYVRRHGAEYIRAPDTWQMAPQTTYPAVAGFGYADKNKAPRARPGL